MTGYVALKGRGSLNRVLKIGDYLRSDDHVRTGDNSELLIGFFNGTSIELESNTDAILDSEVIDLSEIENIAALEELIETMRSTVLAGVNPGLVLEKASADYEGLCE